MRVIIQRVSKAQVTASDKVIGKISKGVLVLLAISPDDKEKDLQWLVSKVFNLRIFDDSEGKMNLSAAQANANFLVVSQFTLYASTQKGNRPSFMPSAPPSMAEPLYQEFIKKLQKLAKKPVFTGNFGKRMEIELVNDGPVTILLDSQLLE